jgi:Flp pilus assembly protein TadG
VSAEIVPDEPRRWWSSQWRSCAGTAAVEFAFVCPILMVFLLGIYSVGSVMHCISSVRYALEETARMLQLNPKLTEDDLQEAIDTKLANYGSRVVTVTLTMNTETDEAGSEIAHLSASYSWLIAVPFIPRYDGAYEQSVDIFLVIAQ